LKCGQEEFVARKSTAKGGPKLPFRIANTGGYLCLVYSFARECVEDYMVFDAQIGPDKQFNIVTPESEGVMNDITPSHLQHMRAAALRLGASPEAVRMLHDLEPFKKKEIEDMASKLSKKADAKAEKPAKEPKAPKAEKPAKAAKEAAPKKGNAEALKKAREARAEAGPDVRKLKILEKDNPYREGSNRAASFDALKGAKTVQDYKDAGGKAKYLSRWAEEGRIQLG
jgi:hypothetical protein